MVPDTVVTRLIRLIHRAQEAVDDYVGSLSDGERSAQGSYEDWAPKDVIAHINYWRRRTVETLAYHSREQPPPDYPDFEQINRETFEENRRLPLEYHLRESRAVVKALDEALSRFEDEDLTDPERYPWREGQPLISYVVSNAYIHPISHLCLRYLKIGDQATVSQLQETALREVSEVDDSPLLRSLALYDQACLLAQSGSVDQAIALLSEILPGSPDLVEWSRKDPDLTNLHNDPRYLVLLDR
jgi:hypothetical protein